LVVKPTSAGREVARKWERLLEDYKPLIMEGTDLKQSQSGTLRIGYYIFTATRNYDLVWTGSIWLAVVASMRALLLKALSVNKLILS
jgi:hypothetical protein